MLVIGKNNHEFQMNIENTITHIILWFTKNKSVMYKNNFLILYFQYKSNNLNMSEMILEALQRNSKSWLDVLSKRLIKSVEPTMKCVQIAGLLSIFLGSGSVQKHATELKRYKLSYKWQYSATHRMHISECRVFNV